LAWVLGAQAVLAGDTRSFVTEGSKAHGLSQCVRPTDFMLRHHMDLIKHQRNLAVHEGIRDTDFDLDGCVACHASVEADGKPIPVNGEEQFCNTCHEFAAVHLDCFDCHATVPNGGPVSEQALRAHPIAGASQQPAGVGQP
jgi:hypothetical protein